MGTDFRHTCQVETWKVVWLIGLVLGTVLVMQCFELPDRESMFSLLSSGKADSNSSDANSGSHGDLGDREKASYGKNNSLAEAPKLGEGNVVEDNLLENTTLMNRTTSEETIIRSISPSVAAAPAAEDLENTTQMNRTVSDETINRSISPSVAAGPAAEDNLLLENATQMNRTISDETIIRSISPSVADISPSVSVVGDSAALLSRRNSSIAPSPERLGSFLEPIVSPSGKIDIDNVAPKAAPPPPIPPNGSVTSSDEKNGKSEKTDPPPPPAEEKPKKLEASVVSISEMNDLLLQSRVSSFSKSPLWPSTADQELLDTRFKIEHEAIIKGRPGLYAPIYRNLSTFIRSYEIMEQKLKVYIYSEGKRPVFHQPRLKGIYASEGWFMKHLKASNQFLTSNPNEAHLFYLPFSSQLLVDYVYVKNSHTFDHILKYLENYIDLIKTKHSFWNRTDGADHFVVGCHDWAAFETRRVMPNCIRALCNADIKEGFQFGKDVSLPETYVHSPQNPLQQIGGEQPSQRKILAFFAGQMHGNVRPILLKHWENKDPDMKIFGRLNKGYDWHMKNSKYCICAKGYEVNSPRVVESIIYGCVPVIISDNFIPPFFDILNWESFAVFVQEKDIPSLKNILVSISERRYAVMQQRVKQVRQHFLWHNTPVKYDIFHMILHSVWFNRLFRLLPA